MLKKTKRSSVAKMGKSIELERRHYYRKAVGLMTTGGKSKFEFKNVVQFSMLLHFYDMDHIMSLLYGRYSSLLVLMCKIQRIFQLRIFHISYVIFGYNLYHIPVCGWSTLDLKLRSSSTIRIRKKGTENN